jgi:F-type H+-transporting ATPase subunit delta
VARRTRHAARQLFRLSLVDARLDESRVRSVAAALTASRRRGSLAVLADFQRMVRLHHHQRSAVVESAERLPDDIQQEVRHALQQRYGTELTAAFGENPALIGGMRIRVGSDVYDGSVRARLATLQAAFGTR